MFLYLQCGQDQEDGEVDLDDHVHVVSREGCGQLADDDHHPSGEGGGQEGGEDSPAKNHLHNDTLTAFNGGRTNLDLPYIVLGQIFGTGVSDIVG